MILTFLCNPWNGSKKHERNQKNENHTNLPRTVKFCPPKPSNQLGPANWPPEALPPAQSPGGFTRTGRPGPPGPGFGLLRNTRGRARCFFCGDPLKPTGPIAMDTHEYWPLLGGKAEHLLYLRPSFVMGVSPLSVVRKQGFLLW